MTEPNEPDKKNNETESTKDEAIIELEEEAAEERDRRQRLTLLGGVLVVHARHARARRA